MLACIKGCQVGVFLSVCEDDLDFWAGECVWRGMEGVGVGCGGGIGVGIGVGNVVLFGVGIGVCNGVVFGVS